MGSTNDQTVTMNMLNPGAMAGSMANAIPHIRDQVVFTCARSPPPPLLAGLVPEDLWTSTFDAVKKRTAEVNEEQRIMLQQFASQFASHGGLPVIPCCLPCIVCRALFCAGGDGPVSRMAELQSQAHTTEQAWLVLAQ